MKFSILTASFNQLAWLKRCVRSVEDQAGVELEHLIQDAGTGPELEDWIRQNSRASLVVAPDRGMYDGLNRALDRATGDIVAILNCDEQYLPGTLAKIHALFERHPSLDLVAGDYLIVDPKQDLLAFRKVTPLRRAMILTDHLYAFTCALFFRREVFERGLRFDSTLKSVADGEVVARILQQGHRAGLLHEYLATFTWTGENLSAQAISRTEETSLRKRLPPWMTKAAPFLRAWRHFERLAAGGYHSGPIEYRVYVGDDDRERTTIRCAKPSFRYPGS